MCTLGLMTLFIILSTLWLSASCLNILPSGPVAKGSSFNVTCSADAIDLYHTFKGIAALSLFKRKEKYLNGTQLGLLSFSYYSIGKVEQKALQWKSQITEDNNLEFSFPTDAKMSLIESDFTKSREIMKISMRVKDATCKDSGYYSCHLEYFDNNDLGQSKDEGQTITIPGEISEFELVVTPNKSISANGQEFSAKSPIRLDCTAVGPEAYFFIWTFKCPWEEKWVEWPDCTEIHHHKKQLIKDGIYRQKETLSFLMKEELDECLVKCKFALYRDSTCSVHTNFHLNLKVNTPRSCSDKGTIVGVVFGLLALVGVVTGILVYIYRYRKQNDQEKWRLLDQSG